MAKYRFLAKIVCAVTVLLLTAGCSLHYTVKDPAPSSVGYGGSQATATTLTIVDRRAGPDAAFLMGQFGFSGSMSTDVPLKLDNIEDPITYFAQHLERELNGRNIRVKCVVAKTIPQGLTLIINRYQILNLRATGFSSWESFHIFSGTIIQDGREKPIKSYFYNSKVPIWSMDEIEEPCFTIPISIVIKDVASSINQALFNLRMSDERVSRLTEEIGTEIKEKNFGVFWKVLELGHANNPRAMESLKGYAQTDDGFFNSCALSAMGTLGAAGEVDFLKQRYRDGGYNERCMAAKAIGDIGTPEALRVIRDMKNDQAYEKEDGLKHCVDLYAQ